ncbi:tenascin-X-like isoform X3 [Salminus brasiliensis]|uniref:tenascin-X-like isoform X3 n=1 Tax=Salminus brasiliensis TaxID=930266 RepID=UPI003B831029
MRRDTFRWTLPTALLGLCVMFQGFSSLTAEGNEQSTTLSTASTSSTSETLSTNSVGTRPSSSTEGAGITNVTSAATNGNTPSETSATTAGPVAVTSLIVSNQTTSSVFLSWNFKQESSVSYRVEWTNGSVSNTDNTSDTSYTVTNLTAGVNYTFNVTAFAADGVTARASIQNSTFTRPDAVTNLTASNQTTSSVFLSWNFKPGSNVSYRVEWMNGNVSNTKNTSDKSYKVTDLTAGVNYTFNVTAVAADGVTTGASVQNSTFTRPDAVTNLIVSNQTTSSVFLSWNFKPGSNVSYRVEWMNGNVSNTKNTSDMSYTVTNLTAGVNYTFNVTAVAADGVTTGASVQNSAFTRPDAVTNLIASNQTTSSVFLSWNFKPGSNVSYRVEWMNGNVSYTKNTSDKSYKVTDLTAGVNYTFNVTAVAADGVTTGASVQNSTFTRPDAVTNLIVSNQTTSSVFLSWNFKQGSSVSYRVEWTNGSVSNTDNTSDTSYTVTNLTAGVNYTFSVTAVAADGVTAGASTQNSTFTRPDAVTNLIVSNQTTSSVFLSWNFKPGSSVSYRVEWMNGNVFNTKNTSDTSYTVTNLTAGVNYTFNVTAVAADGVTAGASTQNSTFTRPDAVTNLIASNQTTSSVFLSWNFKPGSNVSYRVEWMNGNVSYTKNTSDKSCKVTDLTAGVNYTFNVTAVAADGVTTGASVQNSTFTRPDAVTNLIVSNQTTSSVFLSWNFKPGSNVSYRVEWINGNVSNTKNTSDTSYTVTGLAAGVNYTFNVTAVAADGVTAGASTQNSTFTKPDVVSNLTVSDKTTSSVSLSWNLQEKSSYRVGWTNGLMEQNRFNTSNTSYTVTSLAAGVNYTFSVTALAADGETEGAPTQTSAFTRPDAVTNLTFSNQTTSSVFLSWNFKPGSNVSYRVEWTNGNVSNTKNTSDTSYTVTNLTAGVNYTFNVTAFAADGVTAGASAQTSAFTRPDAVTNLTASNQTTSSVFLSWNFKQGSNVSYRVEWMNGSVSNTKNTSDTSYTVTNLTAGVNYTFNVTAFAADGVTAGASTQTSAFTEPSNTENLIASNITTSSVVLNWIKPVGESFYYRVQYSNSSTHLNETTQNTMINITNLTPGVQYTFRVFAVAADNITEGRSGYVSTYTRPEVIRNLTVTEITTNSLFMNWTEPIGQRYFFKVQWTHDNGTSNTTTINTSLNITDLTAGVNYTIRVSAVAADNSTEGNPVLFTNYTKPGIIENLTASNITTSSVVLNWIKAVGESSYYRVQYSNSSTHLNETTQNTMISITDLTPGVQYTFRVFAVAADNITEGRSGYISTYTKPEVIRNLTVTEITTNSLFMNWTEPVGQRYFFKVQWTHDNGTSNTTTINTSLNITDLTAGVNYTIRVSAVAADNSTEGKSVLFTNYTKPGIIENLTASNVTTSSVVLNWIKPVGESSYYRVQYSNSSTHLNETTQNTMISITDLTPGVQYTFRVFAVAADNITEGRSGYVSTYTKPEVIRNLTVTEITTNSLFMNWTEPIGQRYFFKVQWTHDNGTSNTTTINTSLNITDLTAGVNYTIRVSAVAADNSTEGNPVLFTNYTKPGIIENLTASNITTSSVVLNWIKPVGESSYYRVQYSNSSTHLNETTQNTMISITDLTPGVQYTFRVFAVAADNITEGRSGYISTYTKPEAIINLTVIEITVSSVYLNWSEPLGKRYFFRVIWTNGSVTSNDTTKASSFNVTDLTPGVNYTFRVSAVAADNSTEGRSVGLSVHTRPEVIRNLTVTEITTTSLFMNWTEPIGQRYFFKVQWTHDNGTSNTTTINTSLNITDLTAGVNYTIRVSAVAADNSTEGNSVDRSAYTKPDVIKNLTVINVTTSSVTLNWSEPCGKSSYYRVQYDKFSTPLTRTTEKTMISITNLTPGVQYTFRVFAVAADNITEGRSGYISTYTKPEAIVNLTVIEITVSSVYLNWSEPLGKRYFFRVFWTNGSVTSNDTTKASSFNVTDLTPGVNYTFRVSAVAADNSTEGRSVGLSVHTRPEVIRNLTVTEITTTSLFMNWTEPIGQRYFFKVQWTHDNGTSNTTTINTSLNITDLTAGVNYTIRVSAVAADNSTEGNSVDRSAYTKPDVIKNLTVINVTTSSVTLNWSEPCGKSSYYRVQYDNFSTPLTRTTEKTMISITNLTPGVQYTFRVFAVAADNITEGRSGYISTYTRPEVIRNLTVTEITTTSLFMNWTEPIGQRYFFKVQWTHDNGTSNTTTINTSLNITDLTAGVNYTIRVSAVAADNSTEGNSVDRSAYTKPDVIKNLTVINVTTSSVTLNWSEPCGKSSYYRVQYDNFSTPLTRTTEKTMISITNLTPGVQYTFRVFAVAADNITEGRSGYISTYTKPEAIVNLTVIEITVSSVYLNWSEPLGKRYFFRVIWTNGSVTSNDTTKASSFNVTDLTPGVNYTFRVSAVAADNSTEGRSVGLSVHTRPEVIRNLTVTEITTTSLFMNWTEPIGQRYFFKVQWTHDNGTSNTTTINTSLNITDLTAGVNYTIRVSAVAADNSTEGNSVDRSAYTKPDVIKNLTVINVTTSSVTLNWSEPCGKSSYYRVQYDNFSTPLTRTTEKTMISITNLTPGVQYTFRVFAVAADNITEGRSGYISTYTKPEAIVNLTVIEITVSSVYLNWSEPLGKRYFFRVIWTNGSVTSNDTTKASSFNVTDLTPGVNYTFRVSAVAADNSTEGRSVGLSVHTRPEVIRNLTVTEITTTSLFMNWTEPIGQRYFFKVQWTHDNGTSNTTTINTSLNITDLTAGVNYTIRVSAVAADNSTEGNSVDRSAYTKPDVIKNLTVINVTTSSVTLNWSEPCGKSSYYRVQYDNFSTPLTRTTEKTMISITNLTPGVQYTFRVFAVAADNITEGRSGYISTYTKPEAIVNLTVIEITVSSVYLNWSEPLGKRYFFRVIWTNGSVTSNDTTKASSFNVTDLTPGVNYTFRVSAVAADNSTEGRSVGLSVHTSK